MSQRAPSGPAYRGYKCTCTQHHTTHMRMWDTHRHIDKHTRKGLPEHRVPSILQPPMLACTTGMASDSSPSNTLQELTAVQQRKRHVRTPHSLTHPPHSILTDRTDNDTPLNIRLPLHTTPRCRHPPVVVLRAPHRHQAVGVG